ncbi:cytotoxic translational repressor of toxin-antitoxin stability system [Leifsonia sp. H3M29-4]|uniref:cytotoxic translational repressor of toxin-antitoxin stability system n=1 Tax=Salinibacterium metalliresistens TaxID=3031321 RepID=UPI0023DB7A3E|nr:cytotoxic translational repressor of toxin-antitoxin stability system [Salinibacterium metalliresistens]MDF1479380.1 cytotoxic translational repressor of toxin-antitoxin stability system [Salinibacterium metalliresistens]
MRHHATYELTLDDGSILRTRISRPIDRTTYAPSMWAHILRDQLQVTEEVFWACVRHGVLPARSAPAPRHPRALPLHLLNELVTRVGLTPDSAAELSLEQAVEALAAYWRRQI